MSTITKPTLPQTTEAFTLPSFTSQPTVVVDAIWNTMEPEEDGAYTAHLLTTTSGDEHVQFGVISVLCDIGSAKWHIMDTEFYGSILDAAERYTLLSGGR